MGQSFWLTMGSGAMALPTENVMGLMLKPSPPWPGRLEEAVMDGGMVTVAVLELAAGAQGSGQANLRGAPTGCVSVLLCQWKKVHLQRVVFLCTAKCQNSLNFVSTRSILSSTRKLS